MKTIRTAWLAVLLLAATAQAQDRAELDRTAIVGNRELPKVLYILPWKQPLPGVPSGKPLHSVLDETLAPLDRAVFRRQVDYGLQLQGGLRSAATTTSAASTSTPTPAPTGETR